MTEYVARGHTITGDAVEVRRTVTDEERAS